MEKYYDKFDPVNLIEKDNGFILGVYGGEYEFIDSILPTKITTVGESINGSNTYKELEESSAVNI